MNDRCDVAIIGAGITGLVAARGLVQRRLIRSSVLLSWFLGVLRRVGNEDRDDPGARRRWLPRGLGLRSCWFGLLLLLW